jgi:hypothetical protein
MIKEIYSTIIKARNSSGSVQSGEIPVLRVGRLGRSSSSFIDPLNCSVTCIKDRQPAEKYGQRLDKQFREQEMQMDSRYVKSYSNSLVCQQNANF